MLRGLFLVLAILLVVETEALPKVIKIGEYMNLVMQFNLLSRIVVKEMLGGNQPLPPKTF